MRRRAVRPKSVASVSIHQGVGIKQDHLTASHSTSIGEMMSPSEEEPMGIGLSVIN